MAVNAVLQDIDRELSLHRPTFIEMAAVTAFTWALRASCVANKVGVVILSQNNELIGEGYNGPAKDMPHCLEVGCAKYNPDGSDKGDCIGLHAEENAISCVSDRSLLKGATLVTTHMTCVKCTSRVKQARIVRVIACGQYQRVPTGKENRSSELDQALANLQAGRIEFEWFDTDNPFVHEQITTLRNHAKRMICLARRMTNYPIPLGDYG